MNQSLLYEIRHDACTNSWPNSGVASCGALGQHAHLTFNNFLFSLLRIKSDSQLSKYCVLCEIPLPLIDNI